MKSLSALPIIPEFLISKMAEIGPCWAKDTRGHIALMIEMFSEVLRGGPTDHAEVTRDIPYGEHPRQRVDVFLPKSRKHPRPAVIFLHGGAFTEGHRNRTDQINSNVLYYFSRYGAVGINAGYRLAPEIEYPEATFDIARVVEWTRAHSEELSIDKERIFLIGHSAGGAHAASYAYDAGLRGGRDAGLAGLVILSGRVRADNLAENPNARRVEAYYGSDPTILNRVSPVSFVDKNSIDTFVAFAEFENPLIDVHCLELAYSIAKARRSAPKVMQLPKHNHTSLIAHFNTADEVLGRAVCNFIGLNVD